MRLSKAFAIELVFMISSSTSRETGMKVKIPGCCTAVPCFRTSRITRTTGSRISLEN
ncbi:hypothetical protein PF005_g8189 [Phytophthora fragariae]|uniref:Uncharacterized protein n=1 Tax=Phytophthora fragariae TaxID=53985 RepID=A0A6A3YJJ0_9STRA|nr:hypothetical protein PF011_g12638 [Phytophthora fragariae]KAE9095773.1 hypothetical protein PF007_g17261 [Phytophthora fragariae]KAE9129193.1 hypothetical protein PF006_g16087 [Phytophthora fragariae]KAE9218610.1 hypothetical protein PF005_g8189 [Phytophthora fragariae]KAE9297095.1 hypothetical protein PF001_g16558 [Phytophthora fragariae]